MTSLAGAPVMLRQAMDDVVREVGLIEEDVTGQRFRSLTGGEPWDAPNGDEDGHRGQVAVTESMQHAISLSQCSNEVLIAMLPKCTELLADPGGVLAAQPAVRR